MFEARPPASRPAARHPGGLDTTLAAVAAALDARHRLHLHSIACWAPNAHDDVRLAAAIVAAGRALRELLAEDEKSLLHLLDAIEAKNKLKALAANVG